MLLYPELGTHKSIILSRNNKQIVHVTVMEFIFLKIFFSFIIIWCLLVLFVMDTEDLSEFYKGFVLLHIDFDIN